MSSTIHRKAAIRRARRAIQRVWQEEVPPAYADPDIEARLIEAVTESLKDHQDAPQPLSL